MYTPPATFRKRARGIAYIMALLLLTIFSTMAVAFALTTDMNAQKSTTSATYLRLEWKPKAATS